MQWRLLSVWHTQTAPMQNMHNYKIWKEVISESNQATTYYFADNYKAMGLYPKAWKLTEILRKKYIHHP